MVRLRSLRRSLRQVRPSMIAQISGNQGLPRVPTPRACRARGSGSIIVRCCVCRLSRFSSRVSSWLHQPPTRTFHRPIPVRPWVLLAATLGPPTTSPARASRARAPDPLRTDPFSTLALAASVALAPGAALALGAALAPGELPHPTRAPKSQRRPAAAVVARSPTAPRQDLR